MKEPLFKYQSEISWMWTHSDYCNLIDGPKDGDIRLNLKMKNKPYWKKKQKVYLDGEDMVKIYYGDQTKSVFIERVTVVVEEKENSVGFKLYHYSKGRRVGSQYFGVTRNVYYVTYNKKYGNFYSGVISSSKKKQRGKRIRTNNWSDIQSTLTHYVNMINEVALNTSNNQDLDTKHGWTVFYKGLGVFIHSIFGEPYRPLKTWNLSHAIEDLFSFYMKRNGVSLPDGFKKFMTSPMNKSKLVKHKSIVDYFMSMHDLKGKKIRKLLNEDKNLNWAMMIELFQILGVDYFNQLSFTYVSQYQRDSHYHVTPLNIPLNNTEKRNIVNVLNEYVETEDRSNNWNTIEESAHSIMDDHIRFRTQLNDYGETVRIRAKDLYEFKREHDEWVNLLETYKNGYIQRTYSDMMKKELEEFIVGPHLDYYPVLLTNSDEYNGESSHQKNCVRTYVEHPNCFIISIREGSPQGKERATVEYRYFKGSYPKNVQSLGRFNDSLSTNWNFVLEEMNNRVKRLSEKRVIVYPKMVKTFGNGNEVNRQSYWDKKRLVWDNDKDYNETVFDLFF